MLEHERTESKGIGPKHFVKIVTPQSLRPPETKDTNPKDTMENKIRTFEGGATRDTTVGKLNYVKALSPIVMQRYVEYLGEHRIQSDGTQRDWDNWKQGIPQQIYLEGEDRHHRAVWKLIQGFPASDNYGPVTLEDSLCGVMFNVMGMLHEILKEKLDAKQN